MKIVSRSALSEVDPTTECFIIKGVFSPNDCEVVLDFLSNFSNNYKDNEKIQGEKKIQGENWHYWVTSRGNNFDSFLFTDLHRLNYEPLTSFYHDLFDLYNELGERTDLNDFQLETQIQNDNIRTINPLVFWYKANQSLFNFHSHPPENQKFQLVCNLTCPLRDYTGGETIIYNGLDVPDSDVSSPHDYDMVDFRLDQGDVFSFPYSRWHKVNPVGLGTAGGHNARVSLLMPLAPRNPTSQNKYL